MSAPPGQPPARISSVLSPIPNGSPSYLAGTPPNAATPRVNGPNGGRLSAGTTDAPYLSIPTPALSSSAPHGYTPAQSLGDTRIRSAHPLPQASAPFPVPPASAASFVSMPSYPASVAYHPPASPAAVFQPAVTGATVIPRPAARTIDPRASFSSVQSTSSVPIGSPQMHDTTASSIAAFGTTTSPAQRRISDASSAYARSTADASILAEERRARTELEDRELEHVKTISNLEEQLRFFGIDASSASSPNAPIATTSAAQTQAQAAAAVVTPTPAHSSSSVSAGAAVGDGINGIAPEVEQQLRGIITRQQAELTTFRQTVDTYRTRITTLESTIGALVEKERAATAHVDELKSELALLRKSTNPDAIPGALDSPSLQDQTAQIADLKAQLEAAQLELETLISEKLSLSNKLQAREAELSLLSQQPAKTSAEVQQKLDLLEAMNRSLQEQVAQREEDLSRAKESLAREGQIRGQLSQELLALRTRYELPAPRNRVPDIQGRSLPRTPLPRPKGVDADLWDLYVSSDPYQLQVIGTTQLLSIINRGPWPDLDVRTAAALSAIVDADQSGVTFDGFCQLWTYLSSWVPVFRAHDNHKNEKEFAYLPRRDLRKILKECKIPVSERYLTLLIQAYDINDSLIGWNVFVLLAAKGKLVAEQFISRDMDRDNWVTLNYDQFLELMASCTRLE